MTPGGGNLFFQLVNARYEKGAMILTSNRGFAEWGDIFGSPVVATALLDRLLHHAVVIQIEGSSYRMREHAALVPENLRANRAAHLPAPAGKAARTPAPNMEVPIDRPRSPRSAKVGNFVSPLPRIISATLTDEEHLIADARNRLGPRASPAPRSASLQRCRSASGRLEAGSQRGDFGVLRVGHLPRTLSEAYDGLATQQCCGLQRCCQLIYLNVRAGNAGIGSARYRLLGRHGQGC